MFYGRQQVGDLFKTRSLKVIINIIIIVFSKEKLIREKTRGRFWLSATTPQSPGLICKGLTDFMTVTDRSSLRRN